MAGRRYCPGCFEKQSKIDQLLEENERLRQKLRYEERKAKEGFFGSSTPSSKIPFKGNQTGKRKPKGAKPGHRGVGRKGFDETEADQVVPVPPEVASRCPDCGGALEDKGIEERLVIDSQPLKARRVFYRLPEKVLSPVQKGLPRPSPRGSSQKPLWESIDHHGRGHALPAWHPDGAGLRADRDGTGQFGGDFSSPGRLFEKIPARLIEQYRQAPVKHADETSWRTEGQNGYAWLFATDTAQYLSVPQVAIGLRAPGGLWGKTPSGGSGRGSVCRV